MELQIELWQLVTLLIAFFTCIGAFGKVLLSQIEQRFTKFDETRKENQARIDKDFEKLEKRIDAIADRLPHEYVRREDWIRFSATTDAKLDALHRKIDAMTEKLYARN